MYTLTIYKLKFIHRLTQLLLIKLRKLTETPTRLNNENVCTKGNNQVFIFHIFLKFHFRFI